MAKEVLFSQITERNAALSFSSGEVSMFIVGVDEMLWKDEAQVDGAEVTAIARQCPPYTSFIGKGAEYQRDPLV